MTLMIHDGVFEQHVAGSIDTLDELRWVGVMLDQPVRDIAGIAETEYVGGVSTQVLNGIEVATVFRIGSRIVFSAPKSTSTP